MPAGQRAARVDNTDRASRTSRAARVVGALTRPVDGASLAAFRIGFGLLMFAGQVRFLASGWVEQFYGAPTFFFKYWGFEWVEVGPLWAMYAAYVALAALALLIAVGLAYRVCAALFFVGFTYVELIDVTNYLNHYYLVSLLALLLVFVPAHRAWSVDAWLRRRRARRARESQVGGGDGDDGDSGDDGGDAWRGQVPAWALYLIRFQVAIVYVYAGLAKLGTDWLLHAQPLNIWLSARTETPIIGPWLDELWVAYAASWFGFLFDTTIVAWLSWRRTRPYAYAVVLAFHGMTHVFFHIGMFPFIMVLNATIFFAPGWPRRWLARLRPSALREPGPPGQTTAASPTEHPPATRVSWRGRVGLAALALYAALQVLVPLRHLAYPGDVIWNEQGMRWAWKVMIREKHGSITFYVRFPDTGKELQVPPRTYLTSYQEREMAGQPDLIAQLARRIAADYRARGHDVQVRVEARVSLNGRPAALLLDPTRDLSRASDGLGRKPWIRPEPDEPPIQLRPRRGL